MSAIDCAAFERWLDDGADPARASAMHVHAGTCARCAAAWQAMAEVEAWLSTPIPIPAPAGFTDAVMAQVEQLAPTPVPVVVEDMPWWVAIIQQPAVVLASLVSALVMWRGDDLVAVAAVAAAWILRLVESFGANAAHWGTVLGDGDRTPGAASGGPMSLVTIGLAVGLAPVVAIASIALAGWVTRWVARRVLTA